MNRLLPAALLAGALVVLAGCGLVVRRDEQVSPIEGVAVDRSGAAADVTVAPELPPTTLWVEPVTIPSTTIPVPGAPPASPGQLSPLIDPWCSAASNFVDTGTQFAAQIATSDLPQLRDGIRRVQLAVEPMIPVAPALVSQQVVALSNGIGQTVAQLDRTESIEEARQAVTERVGQLGPLVDVLFATQDQTCPQFGVATSKPAADGFQVVTGP